MSFTPTLVIGLVMTLLGAVLLFDRLALVDIRTVLRFWPLLLTLFGLSVIVQALREDGTSEAGGRSRPIVSPGFVLILIVIWLVSTQATDRRFLRSGASEDPELSLLAVMGKDERASTSTAFRGAQMTTVMGLTRLDLRQATLASGGEATVDVLGVMGAVEVFVPEGWTVDLRTTAVMGDTRDRRGLSPDEGDDDDDRGPRRERRRAARDRTDTRAAPAASTPAPQPAGTASTPTAPSETRSPTGALSSGDTSSPAATASDASAAPPPRLVVKGLIVAGALSIRS